MMKRLLKRLKQSSKKTSRNKPAQVAKANHAATGDVSYVKLTIEGNDDFIGKRFKLFYAGKLIWGTEIERAPRGYELEYRNIIVSKKPEQISESKFEIQPKLPIKIEVSDHQFTTPEQDTYDQRFDVRKHGDFWYSMRGNTKKPKKIILTFAGFGPSTTRIPYSVSYISGIGEEDLSNAMLIAFQDRYQVAGDYMIENDRAEALYPKFCSLISGLLKKYQLTDQDLLFFGASKGGGIALRYAEKFPQARLVLAVPQVQLLYYWQSKAFFRNNLFSGC